MLTVDERDFPFSGGYRFRDPETGDELLGDGRALRADFLRRFAEARAALHARLDAGGVRHADHVLDQPLGRAAPRACSARATRRSTHDARPAAARRPWRRSRRC